MELVVILYVVIALWLAAALFYYSKAYRIFKSQRKQRQTFNEAERKKILAYCKNREFISNQEIAKLLKIDLKKAQEHLDSLVRQRYLEHTGEQGNTAFYRPL